MILRRRLLTILAVIAVAYVVYALSAPDVPRTPKSSASIQLTMLDGSSTTLSEYQGKVVVLDFWASWCNPCRMSVPDMNKLAKEYAGKDVVVLAVATDTARANVDKGIKEFGIEYPVVWDHDSGLQAAFQVSSYPTVVIIDKKGLISRKLQGYDPSQTPSDLREQIDAVLAR
ncbi:MAG: TlpA family protein disulfide reductase [Armatimonadota bacterium]